MLHIQNNKNRKGIKIELCIKTVQVEYKIHFNGFKKMIFSTFFNKKLRKNGMWSMENVEDSPDIILIILIFV